MENQTPKKRGPKPKVKETEIVKEVVATEIVVSDTSHEDVIQEIIDSVAKKDEPLFCETIAQPKTKGVLLIALGHSQYGNMAVNLANSIKYNNKNTKIHLVYTESAFSQVTDFSNFDSKEICPKEYYKNGEQTVFIKAKTHLYDLTPFDETIFLDVDTILFGGKDFNKFFDEFKDYDFTSENYGLINRPRKDGHIWFDAKEAVEAYEPKYEMHEIRSQMIYFKKNDTMSNFFDVVKDIFNNPKIKGFKFDGYLPDEMAFNIATGITGVKPHKSPYFVIYWEKTDNTMSWSDVVKSFFGYSIGGNYISNKASTIYHNLAKAQSMGKRHYRIFSKANWNQNRRTV